MQNAKLKNNLHLHVLVFIAGFTAILGELITIEAIPLVWFRMLIAGLIMFAYIKFYKISTQVSTKVKLQFFGAGIIIALHWITFFASINAANISIALAMFSTGAFFASLIEPLIYKRKIIWHEILFGLIVVFGVYLIVDSEIKYLTGILLGIASAFFASLFAVINGRFIEKHKASVISFYEFIGGVLIISIYLFLIPENGFSRDFFQIKLSDWIYVLLLASVCTAYAFIAAIEVMKYLSPFTVVLTYNLEPVYGVILALIIFGESEIMSANFYYGAGLIILTVLFDGILKRKARLFKSN